MEPMLIARENVPLVLELIGGEIEDLLNTFLAGYDTYGHVVKELSESTRQLWILADATDQIQGWLITQIHSMPTEKRLILDMLGGKDIDVLFEHMPVIEKWARTFGATEAMAVVRPGLRKKLKAHGFHHVSDLVIKPLSGVH